MSNFDSTATRYSLFSRTVHWLTVALMIGMFYTGWTALGGGPPPGAGGAGAPPIAGKPTVRSPGFMPGTDIIHAGRQGGGMPKLGPFSKIPLHKAMGFTILLLTLTRLAYRAVGKIPALPADLHPFQAIVARMVQGLIYLGLLTQPLSGWLGSGRAFTYFGIFTMPPIALLTGFGRALRFVHTNGAWVLAGLISLHALGALYHHYVRKDNVLLSMLRG